LSGWRSRHGQTAEGAIESEQRIELAAPVVEFSEQGAHALGRAYWAEVERSTLGVVRSVACRGGVQLRLLGRGPALLQLGEPEVVASGSFVRCRYAITGGVLARRPQGDISFAQADGDRLELSSTIRDFVPTLGARQGEPHWTGALYDQLQSRLHVLISRRFFARLTRAARG
jgi:hypothetical protein